LVLSASTNPSSTIIFLPTAEFILAYRASQAEDSLRAREAAVAEAEEVRLCLESRVKETEGRMAEMAASLEKKGTELAVLRQELEEERDERLKLEEDLEVGGLLLCFVFPKGLDILFVCRRADFLEKYL
jgi:septal ring factor EnvC (AmiA/AmiB activator)